MMKPVTVTGWVNVFVRILTSVAGLVLLAASAVQLFGSDPRVNFSGLVVGAILVALPLVVDRLEHFSFDGTGLEFRFTKQVAELGAPKSAGILEESGLARDLEAYSFVYTELTDPAQEDIRKDLLDRIVGKASALSVSRKFDPVEVHALFAAGSPVMRVLVLGLMEGDPALLDVDVLRSGLTQSRTGNEQFHALKLAYRNWCRLPEGVRTELRGLVATDAYIQGDADRRQIADDIDKLQCRPALVPSGAGEKATR
ncbi:hypothetical protein [Kribbella sp. HUAS MG21]|jgi:hypothetical protein|uniref:DUF4239 domain-containing protein n=1 Tax=Kribbella sp. HUAS MG21 TaxID=3160966 RepID=A0AAU7TGL4_9ACTN